MKLQTVLFVALSLALYGMGQLEIGEVEAAAPSRPVRGMVTIRVVDSSGNPVVGAYVRGGFPRSDSYNHFTVDEGLTDSNGLRVLSGKSVHTMTYFVDKEGYYKTTGKYWFYRRGEDTIRRGRWQPWNPTYTVVLKEKRNPIGMYAMRVSINIPVRDQAIGFDLEKGDWVAPYGRGIIADLLFKFTAIYEGRQTFSKRLDLTFSNAKDGLQLLPLNRSSEFMSIYTAPEGDYAPALIDEQARTQTEKLKRSEIERDHYLVFRVRSVTNEQGKIVLANYAKLYGPNLLDPIIEYGRMGKVDRLQFTYYFNPTPNDRNLEFDPSRNLFRWSHNAPQRVSVP